MSADSENVTQLLQDWSQGNQQALEELLPLIYNELRKMAHSFLYRERTGHTLQTTALVHEAYLKLIDQKDARWQNRSHFFAIAAQAMRRILIDSARRHAAMKRGGPQEKLSLDEVPDLSQEPNTKLLALDEALNALAEIDPEQSRIVELRYFGGLSVEETAEVLGIAAITVMREWNKAKAWLYRELSKTAASNK